MLFMVDTKKVNWEWSDWIVAEREKRGWSQAELARRAETTRQTINDYEGRRRHNPDEKVLISIANALGYPGEHLLQIMGTLPAKKNEQSEEVKQILHELEGVSREERLEFLSYIRWRNNKLHRSQGRPSYRSTLRLKAGP